MKLCRFELKSRPGEPRSGIVYGAKIYETDGANPIATYEADVVRPLPPIGHPPTVRFFEFDGLQIETLLGEEPPSPLYQYGNSHAIVGPSTIVQVPSFVKDLDFRAYFGVVVAQPGARVPLEVADDLVLGFTLGLSLVARDVEREERKSGISAGKSRDFTLAIGPVLTTPDELEEVVTDDSRGRRYQLRATMKVNGEEVGSGDISELRYSHAECIVSASEGGQLAAGDLLLLGPVIEGDPDHRPLEAGDEIQLAVERLGSLSIKVSQ